MLQFTLITFGSGFKVRTCWIGISHLYYLKNLQQILSFTLFVEPAKYHGSCDPSSPPLLPRNQCPPTLQLLHPAATIPLHLVDSSHHHPRFSLPHPNGNRISAVVYHSRRRSRSRSPPPRILAGVAATAADPSASPLIRDALMPAIHGAAPNTCAAHG